MIKRTTNTIEDLLSPLRSYFQRNSFSRKEVDEKPPLRSELFTREQMEAHAQWLAAHHQLSFDNKLPEQLLKRLSENEEVLEKVAELLHEAVKEKKRISPAGEWLLDNFYLIEEQVLTGKKYLPKGYSKGLPRLTNSNSFGLPRVYDIALEIISHSDGHVDISSLSNFIASYQKVTSLTIGELWAVPIVLRLALLENLSRVAAKIAIDRIDENLADFWSDKMINAIEKDPKSIVLIIADMARSEPPMVSAFVAPFTQRLQWKGADMSIPISWLEQHLTEKGLSISAMTQSENQQQAANQVSMSNSINSLRFLAKMDWREFVETMSVTEQTLRTDIHGLYQKMDFYTRDSYRHAVEKISKRTSLQEQEVAAIAIELAARAAEKNADDIRLGHVGYYLVGKGRAQTEAEVKQRSKGRYTVRRNEAKRHAALYKLTAWVITIIVAGLLLLKADADGDGLPTLIVTGVLSLIAASQFALQISNWLATLIVKPKQLPRMDFSGGIPQQYRTMVVVPSMLVNKEQTGKLLEELEVRFLANRDENLFFALLTDFKDAPQQTMEGDAELMQLAENGIRQLNHKYGRVHNDTFFLFHRKRVWNKKEKIWMGWERKRGKLEALNSLLRGKMPEDFILIVGEELIYTSIKYVITLDADTQLPREAAWKLAGIMAHPLNHPVYNEKKNIVTDGYGIIQPRIAISLHGTVRSQYTRMHENDSGIDPYTRITSNVYQDVFSEGSFIGKGIYDVDVFEKVLTHRFPENKILSHDLLEGSYARCAFASDVQFYEDYPSKYRVDMNRRHRWIRGDWQIANWILPWVPNGNNRLSSNPVSGLSKWKIFDNLRRSVVPIALLALLVCGWTVLNSAWFWTLAVVGIGLLPSILASALDILRKPDDVLMRYHISNSAQAIYRNITEAVFALVVLPYEAYISLDAIVRSAWRMLVTKRKLLEWNPYGFDQNSEYKNLFSVYLSMWPAPLITAVVFIYLSVYNPFTLVFALPVLIAWALSPAIVWWLSRPMVSGKTSLSEKQVTYLRKLSRKTWAFYENFVGPEDNWLPPDNFQQHPVTILAHRTSPTNIGLALLANLSAFDFGYITVSDLEERTRHTLTAMQKLERYAGHFYNWYDTITMQPLHPRYISVVDSGNLGAHLLVLKQGLLSLGHEPVVNHKNLVGVLDTLYIVRDNFKSEKSNVFKALSKELKAFADKQVTGLAEYKSFLDDFSACYHKIFEELGDDDKTETYWWAEGIKKQIKDLQDEIAFFAPWAEIFPVPAKFSETTLFAQIPTLHSLAAIKYDDEIFNSDPANTPEENNWLQQAKQFTGIAAARANEKLSALKMLSRLCDDFADMEYDFLYDRSQHLFTIGYNAEEHKRDGACYDLLASEARLASFLAIAQGKIPQENWFALGRRLTNTAGSAVLLSWSGSMFEYLMPNLVMPTYDNTLIDHSNKGSVKRQIEYGRQQGTVWGISESCYNVVDAHLNYQYRAFGVPGLGFKRGLGEDHVIAPYATVMALMVDAASAFENIERMVDKGYEGKYGLYESVDFTASRMPRGQDQIIIQTFMVHHLGMSLLSLAYVLLDQPMQKRFEAEPQFQATLLLLQEQIPRATNYYSSVADTDQIAVSMAIPEMRVIKTAHTPVPEVQLLSNGSYHVMVSNSGGGYSRWRENAVTRWREDTTCDNWGTFCYIRDLKTNNYWSNACQPTMEEAKLYETIFSQGRVEFRRIDNQVETHTEIIVSPEDDVEIRRVQISNRSGEKREIDITSYAEVVLANAAADAAHPAFSNLFVQTEIVETHNAILCTRRPRSSEEQQPWMFHLMKVNNKKSNAVSYETDRSRFIGRGNSISHPKVMQETNPLSNSQGSVLDPVVAIRYTLTLEAEDTITLDMMLGVTDTKEDCRLLVDKYQDRHLRDRAFELSWTHSQVTLRQINASEADAQLFGKMAGSVIYANPHFRAEQDILLKNQRGQSGLWSYSISGDLPIVLLQITSTENMDLVKQLIQARAYWQLKGLSVDLFIWNEDESGYRQVLQEQVQSLITASTNFSTHGRQGGVFVRPVDQISMEDRILLQAVARVIISDKKGSLADQLRKKIPLSNITSYLTATQNHAPAEEEVYNYPDRVFNNGLGGFAPEGHEYIITTGKQSTPAPWVNIIANKNFGTILSERGSSYTWFENAHSYRLTPWHNDPVQDTGGEAFYIRDEKTGHFWSPAPYPVKGLNEYVTKHGFGYSVFEHRETGIVSDMEIFIDTEAPVKFIILNLQNESGRQRKLSVTGFVQWVLGDLAPKSAMHIVTQQDAATGAVFAANPYNTEFAGKVCFFDTDDNSKTFTASRTEFIGRNGSLQKPDAMKRVKLSGRYGAGLDSCAALQINVELAPGEKKQVIFRLGAANSYDEVRKIIQQFKGSAAALEALARVHHLWETLLHKVKVETPDAAFNYMANGWLMYQTIACRLWGRSGFYQSGGAYGFRDQLQDTLAALHADVSLTKDQVLLAASRQFKEGDAQHWWHPPLGRGVRTHCSDDYLWLPFVTAKYIQHTGDHAILDEIVGFLEGRPVNQNEESYYDLPGISPDKATLYEHCRLAVQHGFRYGVHGLPLIGAGDWNDGMNMVGKDGKGESVWLGFFLYDVLQKFIPVAKIKGDETFAAECEKQAAAIKDNINKNAWDGNWYLRAFFDDGTPIGSSKNEECKIDSISQSWSVLSGAGEPGRSKQGMQSLEKHLVRRDAQLIQLLNPPFDKSDIDPGYIKGYVPGVRENGGQYTHAAVWTVMAFAKMREKEKTWDLLKMLNPVMHGIDANAVSVYKVEPYVMAADVYGVAPHTSRGGWTWYTGSAGWYYQLMIESFIGLKVENDELSFDPCLPAGWNELTVHYRYKNSSYRIKLERGTAVEQNKIKLVDDKQAHDITVYFN